MRVSTFLALVSGAAAQFRGFNYGATDLDGSPRTQQDFEDQFNAAKKLAGQTGVFTSGRLYTMIQAGTSGDLTQAIPAAVSTDTNLLLGLWGSAGQDAFNLELAALKYAAQNYPNLASRVAGISVGSEDLYRNSPTGILNKSGQGATPAQIADFIGQVRTTIAGTSLSGVSVGHVDTVSISLFLHLRSLFLQLLTWSQWTAYVNASNTAVIDAADWLGVDAYPYFQNTEANGIENGETLFFDAYNATVNVAQGKPVWITETGWPVAGPASGAAVASDANAQKYWRDVACRVLGSDINVWWFTLDDDQATSASVSFSLVNSNDITGAPLYDLSCPASSAPSSTASASSTATSGVASKASSAMSSVASSASSASSFVTSGVVSKATSLSSAASSAAPYESSALSSAASYASSAMSTSIAPIAPTYQSSASSALSSVASSMSSVVSASGSAVVPTYQSTFSTAISTSTKKAVCPAPTKPAQTPIPQTQCPTDLSGAYEYPHLIVAVDSTKPATAEGISYNATVSSTVSTIFDFDIKPEDVGKTCSLVFLFPEQKDLETSSFTFNGKGGIKVTSLTAPATEQTTYNTVPAAGNLTETISSVAPGNSYSVASMACPAGQRIGFEFSSTDGLELSYFQDFNPSPIGAYITVC